MKPELNHNEVFNFDNDWQWSPVIIIKRVDLGITENVLKPTFQLFIVSALQRLHIVLYIKLKWKTFTVYKVMHYRIDRPIIFLTYVKNTARLSILFAYSFALCKTGGKMAEYYNRGIKKKLDDIAMKTALYSKYYS